MYQQPQLLTSGRNFYLPCYYQGHNRTQCPNRTHAHPTNPTPCTCKDLPIPFGAQPPAGQQQPFHNYQQIVPYQAPQPPPLGLPQQQQLLPGIFGLPAVPAAILPADPVESAVTQMLQQYPHLRREQVLPVAQEAVNRASAAELAQLRQQLGFQQQPYQQPDTPTGPPPGENVIHTDTLTAFGWHQVRDHFLFNAPIHNDNEAGNLKLRQQITQGLLLPHAQRFKPNASKTRITFVEIQTNIAVAAGASYQVFVGLYDHAIPDAALTDETRRAAICGTTITDDQQERRTLTLPLPRCPVANETFVGIWQFRNGNRADGAAIEVGNVTLTFGFEYQ